MYKEGHLVLNIEELNEGIQTSQIERNILFPERIGEAASICGTVYVNGKITGLKNLFNKHGYCLNTHLNIKRFDKGQRCLIESNIGKVVEIEGIVNNYDHNYRVGAKKEDCTKICLDYVRLKSVIN